MNFRKLVIIIVLALLLPFETILSQNKRVVDPDMAKEHFSHHNYVMALPFYKELVKQQPKSIEYNLNTALCYLKTNINKAAAIPYLEFLSGLPKPDEDVYFNLGMAYQYAYRFDEAISAYEKCTKYAKGNLLQLAERQIETCNNAKELIKYPVDAVFISLGKQVNSEFPDYNPLISSDESFMVFTSRRPRGSGTRPEMDGYYSSDVYISYPKDGVWQKPKEIGSQINTSLDEQAVDLSPDGKLVIVYLDHIDSAGNIYYSENTSKQFSKLVKFERNINSGFETSGTVSNDRDLMVFASKRPDGYGETDLYMVKKLPNGNWALPQLLGNQINTKLKEDYPHLAADGKTLYFASQGHSSMGGFDLFKSIYTEETNTWSPPENLGYPINSPDDDLSISFTGDGCYGYLSTTRDGGFGDLDLYKVKINKNYTRYSIVTGYVSTSDTMGPYIKKQILAVKADTKEIQKFTPVKVSGKFVMALSPGKYTLTVKAEGYDDFNFLMTIIDVPFQPEIRQDFQLNKTPTSK